MGYRRINIITGWIAFLIAFITYSLTVEPTASFWDSGEFIACSYKLEVPHPPGAPFFLLTGRMFSMLAGSDVTQVAYWVNMLSVLSSAFFVLFIFWSITHLSKRILGVKNGEESLSDMILLMGAGLTGSLACTYSDSFWFSAVEAEVYGMSAFFTSFVLWAILRWENMSEEQDKARWLILIAYMIGLSIGVHLLNLVALPVLGLIMYFKNYEKVTWKGIVATLIISSLLIIVVLEGIIPGFPSLAGSIEIAFVNNFGLPFGSGVIFFLTIFLGVLICGIYYSVKYNKYILNTALLCLTFVIIGYSSYSLILIRSKYNPPIDENNPEDIISFVSYLKREQYGSRPLFRGQYYTAQLKDQLKGDAIYMRGEDKYEVKDYRVEYKYDPAHTTIFPRMYSSDPWHIKKYQEVTGLKQGEKPSFSDNIAYLFKHQLGHQYMRYFKWNFIGRESDIQGANYAGPLDFLREVPDSLANNRGRNFFFGLPLLLGLLGIVIQARRDVNFFSVTALLFVMTGIAIVVYLNTPPIEPRERDYIYAGSFYIFTIWIGFGVLALYDIFSRMVKNKKVVATIASVLGLGIPVLMASQTWDDHDRSDRYFSVDAAKNYLDSCAPNAILFTGGDNDTFPLWYIQEVEGFRTDVRVVVLSYFNTDWYINQMMRPAYDSEPLPFGLSDKHYLQGGLNDYLPVIENPNIKGAINAEQFLKLVETEHPQLKIPTSISSYNSVPSKSLFLSGIDTNKIKAMIPENLHGMVQDRMIWNIKGRALEKKDLAVLDLIINSNWDRPIYFNNTSLAGVNLDLRNYVVQEGITYRLLPVQGTTPQEGYPVNTEVMYDNVMNKFHWRGLNDPSIYYTEDYLGFCLNLRSAFNSLARALIDRGEPEKAAEVLKKCLEVMPNESIPYDYFNVQSVGILIETGELELANHIADVTSADSKAWLDYYIKRGVNDPQDLQKRLLFLNELARAYRANDERERANTYEELFTNYYTSLVNR